MSQGSLAGQPQIHRRRLFVGSFFALVATAFGFVIRTQILDDWRTQFNLSDTQIGTLNGVGLFPFAITIILFSLIVDRIGYGRTMIFAFVCHTASAIITMCAPLALVTDPAASAEQIAHGKEIGYWLLYIGTFVLALGNGTVEAVVNPVVATIYEKNKTHWLNILHAGWPGGLVLGGVLAINSGSFISYLPDHIGSLTIAAWQWKVALVLLPTLIYGILFLRQRFPVQERVAAGVSYLQMLKQFGALSCFIVSFLLVMGIDQIAGVFTGGKSFTEFGFLADMVTKLTAGGMPKFLGQWIVMAGIAAIPTIIFLISVRALGRAMFVFLLLVMVLLATTELGVDSWIADIMKNILAETTNGNANAGNWVLIYTSSIMFVLRFFAGPIVHKISPLGLLATCAALAAGGILWLSAAGSGLWMVFGAATLYGVGKTFFWPTTLGVVSEQYPKGGALLLNAIAGVGMISVGVLGNPAIGVVQDRFVAQNIEQHPELTTGEMNVLVDRTGPMGHYMAIDQQKKEQLPPEKKELVDKEVAEGKRIALRSVAILPAIMCLCYIALILYFRSRGGYKPQDVTSADE